LSKPKGLLSGCFLVNDSRSFRKNHRRTGGYGRDKKQEKKLKKTALCGSAV
jgi:hypothetical protein